MRPVPAGTRLRLAPATRRPQPAVLVGGSPVRVLRLTPAGTSLVDRWMAGSPVGSSPAERLLAARLVESGAARPDFPGPATPTVEVVVPVRDDPAGLAATVAAVAPLAVTVVDDGSSPPLGAPPPVKVLRRPSPGGPAAARNAGWAQAGAEVVVFVDAGVVLEPGWLEELLVPFADPATAAAAPRVRSRPGGGPLGLDLYESGRSPLDMGPDESIVRPGARVPYLPTAALAVRREALEAVGGFDQALRFGEDVDLVWRLAAAGWRVWYRPSARATHPARPGWAEWLGQRYQYGRSGAPLAARHGSAVAPLAVSPWSALAWALTGAGFPAAGAAVAAGSAAALWWRWRGDPALARHLASLALAGHVRAGGAVVGAVRRAYLPPVAAALVVVPRARRPVLAGLAAAAGADWVQDRCSGRAGAHPALRLADDLAYQAGVWSGVLANRSLAPLAPGWKNKRRAMREPVTL